MTDTATTQSLTHVRIMNDGTPEFMTWTTAREAIEAAMGDRENVVQMSAKGDHANMTYRNGDQAVIRPATEDDYLVGEPEWGTLKGLTAPLTVWLETAESGMLHTAGNRRRATGRPVRIVSVENRGCVNRGRTESGQDVYIGGTSARMWRHQ